MKGKTKSILAILGTLAIGVFLGMLIAGQVFRSRVSHMRELRQGGRFKTHLIESVHPTDEQRAAITPILNEFGTRMESMHKRHMMELRENHTLLRERLSEHLDGKQMELLKKELRRMSGPHRRRMKGPKKKKRRDRE